MRKSALNPPEATLIGPRSLRAETRRFVETARGQMIWFNVCFTMFRRQEVFDMLLRPAIENAHVDSIQFIAGANEVEVGTNLIYGAIHQFGGAEVGIDIPARPYLGISAENAADIEAVVVDFIEGVLR